MLACVLRDRRAGMPFIVRNPEVIAAISPHHAMASDERRLEEASCWLARSFCASRGRGSLRRTWVTSSLAPSLGRGSRRVPGILLTTSAGGACISSKARRVTNSFYALVSDGPFRFPDDHPGDEAAVIASQA